MPYRPYCTYNPTFGLLVRPREKALKYSYIQLNPSCLKWVLVFDLDHFVGWYDAEEAGLLSPTWLCCTPDTGYAHAAYVLSDPVCTSDAARLAPLRYLAAIEEAYRRRLDGDPGYSGLITKNPISWPWVTVYNKAPKHSYSLDELAACVRDELKAGVKRERPVGEIAGLGRNCYIFEKVRLWAYSAIRDYWDSPCDWIDAVTERCVTVNAGFYAPLYGREVYGIAKSIARWTMERFSREKFSELQRNSVMRRWEKESRKAGGLNLFRAGLNASEVAEACSVHVTTARRWREEAEPERRTVTDLKPWDSLGMSRATWYRKYSNSNVL